MHRNRPKSCPARKRKEKKEVEATRHREVEKKDGGALLRVVSAPPRRQPVEQCYKANEGKVQQQQASGARQRPPTAPLPGRPLSQNGRLGAWPDQPHRHENHSPRRDPPMADMSQEAENLPLNRFPATPIGPHSKATVTAETTRQTKIAAVAHPSYERASYPPHPSMQRPQTAAESRNWKDIAQRYSIRIQELEVILKDKIAELSQVQRSVKQQEDDLRSLRHRDKEQRMRITELTDRLSSEMNAKMSRDESSLENINMRVRPMTIAEDFGLFCSNIWLETCIVLEEKLHAAEDDRYQFLCRILLICHDKTKAAHSTLLSMAKSLLTEPVRIALSRDKNPHKGSGTVTTPSTKEAATPAEIPEHLGSLIKDEHRKGADTADLDCLVEETEKYLREKYQENVLACVHEYIVKATRLTWKMAVQKPPMSFDVGLTGSPWNDKLHLEPYFGSNLSGSTPTIKYYVHPTLCHAGKTMVKGKVMVR